MIPPFFSHGLLLLAGLCCLLPRSLTINQNENNIEPDIDRFQCQKVALTISNFSISLFKEMAQKSKQENILFSPIRVVAAMSMFSLGAKDKINQMVLEGLRLNKTGLPEAEIHKFFHYLLSSIKQPIQPSFMKSNIFTFIQEGLQVVNKFVNGAKKLYNSEVIPINFTDNIKTETVINQYVKMKGSGEISGMIKSLKVETFLTMVDFIIWNGRMTSNFDCQVIRTREFYVKLKTPIRVPMIDNVDVYHLFGFKDLFSTVLIYVGTPNSPMTYFIIPDKGKMKMVEHKLTYPHFLQMVQQYSLR